MEAQEQQVQEQALQKGQRPEEPKEGSRVERRRLEVGETETLSSNEVNTLSYIKSMLERLNEHVKNFVGGQICSHLMEWKKLTSDPEILDIVKGAHIEFDSLPFQKFVPSQIRFSNSEIDIIEEEIKSLLSKQIIVKCEHENGEFISKHICKREKGWQS